MIFDFDGTLVDSRRLIIESHRVVFSQFGLAVPSEDESLSLIGMSLELVLLQLAGPDAPVEKMVAAYQGLLPLLRADAGSFVSNAIPGNGESDRQAFGLPIARNLILQFILHRPAGEPSAKSLAVDSAVNAWPATYARNLPFRASQWFQPFRRQKVSKTSASSRSPHLRRGAEGTTPGPQPRDGHSPRLTASAQSSAGPVLQFGE
jgi:hypothetical protein